MSAARKHRAAALLSLVILIGHARPTKKYPLQTWKNITCRAKGRFQDRGYCDSPIIDQIVADGKAAIPVLISQITETAWIANPVYDFWPRIRVGELAFFILTDLFLDDTWTKSTMPPLFPPDNCDKNKPGWECWSDFRKTHSLALLQSKWSDFWKSNQDRISWDDKARCFRVSGYQPPAPPPPDPRQDFTKRLVAAAMERTQHTVRYVAAYVKIPYPGGDVPPDTGVCSDEVIRAYRALGIDLQKEVHEDMAAHFSKYPHPLKWFAFRTDANIDHRRVPNLMTFFSRKGESLAITPRSEDYSPGDLVTWDLGGNVPHIGIVVDRKYGATGRYMLVHNIGAGPKMEDVLFNWKITGHYRYFGPQLSRTSP